MKYMFSHFQPPMLSSSEQLKMCDKLLIPPQLIVSLFTCTIYPNLDEFLQFNIQTTGQKSHSIYTRQLDEVYLSHFQSPMLSSSEQLKVCDKLLDSTHSLFESLVTCAICPNLDEFP
ncbi:hypothetical protein CEXT_487351 [Caerostris extrusa]|uniref:Uncharacterized protein n=1 Tax=Caerostris extrusa TaxID=172846 RepID=A0AAV4XBH4_CAEEX|nr:hypothetical protein CEXT_487351 [Caerostris extrusa]